MKRRRNIYQRFLILVWSLGIVSLTYAGAILLSDDFNYPDGLVANEYAFWNPTNSLAIKNPIWELDSGSFFAINGQGWTGVPDDVGPNALSTNGNDSCVFRLNTRRNDFENVAVSFSVLNQGLSTTARTPAVDWDGLHIWLRYQSEYNLYYTSINRRDNTVIIKKKIPGGPSNGGTYYPLSNSVKHTVPYGSWQNVKATALTNPDSSVTISLYNNDALLVRAVDDGHIGGPPIKGPGKVGIRGDNANLKFENFIVTSLDPVIQGSVPAAPTNLSASAGDTKISLSWDRVSGATGYNIYRSQTTGVLKGNGFKIGDVENPFLNSALTNGTTYYLVVTAVNAEGESVESPQVSVCPARSTALVVPKPTPSGSPLPSPSPTPSTPSAPTGLTAVSSNGQINLRWSPVEKASSYNIYRSPVPRVTKSNGFKIGQVPNPNLEMELANGSSCYLAVSAVNSFGESPLSTEVSAIPFDPSAVPAPPMDVRGFPGNKTATISWNPVLGAVSYNLYRSRTLGVTKGNGYQIQNVKSPYLNTGFANGTVYYMVVTALNAAGGESAESSQVSVTPSSFVTGSSFASALATTPTSLDSLRVFPTPWRSNLHSGVPITFDSLTPASTIKIFNTAGQGVTTFSSDNPQATWGLVNEDGHQVASGIYFYLVTNNQGEKKHGTLAVIR